ncbi:biotin/lipoate A/B protein ligase [Sulfobacillus acidophilus DSM 10332]|uniref:Biotin/lipoate A/B protein ligase n=1 Tax=Sulfobacillus acidophilus (strain ATCC 700253 / DSM 10332 / NAL) TaxID=679936 RepID=G8TWN7_SULAD|nr:biotin/lipoate A/B protein ligase [Sulfobacillus acidophilus DSM 10332]
MRPRARLVQLSREAPPEQLRLSPVLAETVARSTAASGEPAVIIRHQPAYVLLGPKDRRLPRLYEAVQWLESLGYPVLMRLGGGSAVLLDGHCLSFGVTRPCRDFTQWEKNFREMAWGAILGLRQLGIPADFGRAEGSYCEGPFDLVANGQKIAGIAQTIRGGYALVSGMVLWDQDPVATTALIQEFYERAGSDLRLRPEAVTALVRLPGQSQLTLESLEARLIQGFRELYDLVDHPLEPAEWALAESLYHTRVVQPTHMSTTPSAG